MKNIIYYNKELKNNSDFEKELIEDNYEIRQLIYKTKDEELDYWLNIIKSSYGIFGDITVEDIKETITSNNSDRITDIEIALAKVLGGTN
jgi:hypothetical protein